METTLRYTGEEIMIKKVTLNKINEEMFWEKRRNKVESNYKVIGKCLLSVT